MNAREKYSRIYDTTEIKPIIFFKLDLFFLCARTVAILRHNVARRGEIAARRLFSADAVRQREGRRVGSGR